jgi:tRNA-specific 2-thiouridylase
MRLAEEGTHELTAFYLKIWLEDEMAFLGSCPWQEDLEFVRSVCRAAEVPLEVVSLQQEYLRTVVDYAVAELEAGRTPSPDVVCNRMIKFGAFIDRTGGRFERVASGHHARVEEREGVFHLLRSRDAKKDQTYFLCQLTQEQLAQCLFPIGELTKAQVRDEAHRLRLANAERPDSQGICFLGRVPFGEFTRHHLGERPGEIRRVSSREVLGTHPGTWFYTIGQRRGLGLAGGPWYVVGKNLKNNVIEVAHADELAKHSRSSFRVAEPHWIAEPPQQSTLTVKIRHGEHLEPCRISEDVDGSLTVDFDSMADPGVAPGQFAAFYDGVECLGGGVIE